MINPRCERTDCFGCEDGHCTVLNNNRFKNGKPCPFFKTRTQVKFERERADWRLKTKDFEE